MRISDELFEEKIDCGGGYTYYMHGDTIHEDIRPFVIEVDRHPTMNYYGTVVLNIPLSYDLRSKYRLATYDPELESEAMATWRAESAYMWNL
jgi:hypothetical protein